ncbi:MAG: (Fe-S)-binding protein [Holophaga sp.]|nr:(Fe-S)-binding protein [Holophaga sp.]
MAWKDLEPEVVPCSRCGACQQVCPIYQELGSEASSARGKIALIRAAGRGWSTDPEALAGRMSLCLACKACAANCPSGVRGDRLVLAARRNLVDAQGLPPLKRLVLRMFLRHKAVFGLGLRLGSFGQRLFFRRVRGGFLPRLPMGLDTRRLVPALAARPLRSRFPATVEAPGARGVVALFTGCMVNHVYPEIGEAALKVLHQQGITVVIPPSQHCCGLAAHANGDQGTALELGRAVLDCLGDAKVDAVLTLCGSCGSTLKNELGEWFEQDPALAARAKALSIRVQDFAEYLAAIGLRGPLAPLEGRATYHESCHLTRGQGVKTQPRDLIRAIPGLEFRELAAPGRCCGSAGSFSLAHYDLTLRISARKTEDIRGTGADTVVTGCPSCVMQLRDGLHQAGESARVVHLAQLLAEALPEAATFFCNNPPVGTSN